MSIPQRARSCAFCETTIVGEGFDAQPIALPTPWGSNLANEDVPLHWPCYVELVNIVRRVLHRPLWTP